MLESLAGGNACGNIPKLTPYVLNQFDNNSLVIYTNCFNNMTILSQQSLTYTQLNNGIYEIAGQCKDDLTDGYNSALENLSELTGVPMTDILDYVKSVIKPPFYPPLFCIIPTINSLSLLNFGKVKSIYSVAQNIIQNYG